MPPTASPTTTLLYPWNPPAEVDPFPTACFHLRAPFFCFNGPVQAFTSHRFTMLLSTGDPYSVVLPYKNKKGLFIIYEDEPACRDTHVWWGVPCRFVRVRIGLPVLAHSWPRPLP